MANSIKLFVDCSKVNKTDFYKMIDVIIDNFCKKKDIFSIKKSIKEQYYDIINFENTKAQISNEILIKLIEQPNSIKFLFNSNKDKLLNMDELSFVSESTFLTRNDLVSFEKCIEFIENLRKNEKIKTDIDLITNFKKTIDEDKDLVLYFDKYVNNYGQIEELLQRNLRNSDNAKKKIIYIYDNSQFILTNKSEKFFTCYYQTEYSQIKLI